MNDQELDHGDWVAFFDHMSTDRRGERVSIEIIDGDNPRELASNARLVAVMDNCAGSAEETISIMTGDGRTAPARHGIGHPVHVRVLRADDGRERLVEIESVDHQRMVLRFGPPPTGGLQH